MLPRSRERQSAAPRAPPPALPPHPRTLRRVPVPRGRWRCLRRRKGPGCRGDDLPAGSAARLSGGSECHVPSAKLGSGAGGWLGAGNSAEPDPATLIARRHGLFAERRDSRRGHGRLPRPAGKSSDGGPRSGEREAGPGLWEAEAPTGPFPEAARPDPHEGAATAAAALAEAGSRGHSHSASPERPGPGSPALGGQAGAGDGIRRLRRGTSLAPFPLHSNLCPLLLNS